MAEAASSGLALPLLAASYISSHPLELPDERVLVRETGHVAEWLRSGLQNRLRRFNSGRGLHS
jgi:hypothetical protein